MQEIYFSISYSDLDTKLSRNDQNMVELKNYTGVVLDVVLNIFFLYRNLSLLLILFITFKAIPSPDKLLSNSQPKYVTFEYCLILTSPYCIFRVPIFLFSIFGKEKARFSFILTKVNHQFVIHKPVTYIGEVLSEFFFYSLQIFMLK